MVSALVIRGTEWRVWIEDKITLRITVKSPTTQIVSEISQHGELR
jgi:hypothetical protein